MATFTGGITASKAVDIGIRNTAQFKHSVVPSWNARLLAGDVTAEDVAVRLYAAVANSRKQLIAMTEVPGFNAASQAERHDPTLDAVAEVLAITDLQQAVLDLITVGAATITPVMDTPANIYANPNESTRSILSNRFGAGATAAIRAALTAVADVIND